MTKDDDSPIIYRVGFNHPKWLFGISSIKSSKPPTQFCLLSNYVGSVEVLPFENGPLDKTTC